MNPLSHKTGHDCRYGVWFARFRTMVFKFSAYKSVPTSMHRSTFDRQGRVPKTRQGLGDVLRIKVQMFQTGKGRDGVHQGSKASIGDGDRGEIQTK